jgi:spermidine/putrescine transport system ATP-binding protein
MGVEADADVRFARVTKRFGRAIAVRDLTLAIPRGAFFSLLGPSGCGKTTTLRLVAGFEQPDEGEVYIRAERVTQVPPFRRDFGMVFQNFALFPHLNVAENVAFGLKMLGVGKADRTSRVREALALVRLDGFAERFPKQLSGGQQQRVAIARAIVMKPAILLLDEPLGALDKNLREEMQVELRSLQRQLGITALFVTHDQEEALTMSDRLAVMSNGQIEQVGPPKEVYEEPSTAYVADFLGVSNLMDATAYGPAEGGCRVRFGDFELIAGQGEPDAHGEVKLSIRPERVDLEETGTTGPNRIPGMVERLVYVGSTMQVIVNLAPGEKLQALLQNEGDALPFQQGTAVSVHLPQEALRVLPQGEISDEGFTAAAQALR